MKRLSLYLVAAIIFVGCNNLFEDEQTSHLNRSTLPTLTAGFEEDTRTYVKDNKYLRWHEGDLISVFHGSTLNSQYKFTGKTGDNGGEFVHIADDNLGTGNTLDRIYAIYPYDADATISELGIISYSIPATQTYAETSFGRGANVMVAATKSIEDTFLAFKNVGGYLKIKLYGNGVVKSIVVKGNNDEKIAGRATVTVDENNVPQYTLTDAAITLDCGDGVTLSNTSQNPTEFWVVVPPTTFENGITITVTDINGSVFEKSTKKQLVIERNIIQPMVAVEVEFEYDSPFSLLPEDSDPTNLTFNHRVLLVDHTGVNCGYCPDMMDKLAQLAGTEYVSHYNEVACHAGYYATGDEAGSNAATVVNQFYGISGYPTINLNFYGAEVGNYSWSSFYKYIGDEFDNLIQPNGANAGIAVATLGDDYNVTVLIGVKAAVTDEYKVTAWLLENNIYNPNQSGASSTSHINQNHALRNIGGKYDSNDLSGDSLGKIAMGEVKNHYFEIPIIGSKWVVDNMDVLVIVSAMNSSGKYEVVNTALCPVGHTIDYYGVTDVLDAENVEIKKLETPTVRIESQNDTTATLSWEAIDHATGYVLEIEDSIYGPFTTSATSYTLELTTTGTYNISVQAISNSYVTSDADSISITMGDLTNIDWFTATLKPNEEDASNDLYPYNSLTTCYKGKGVTKLSHSLFNSEDITDDLTDSDIIGYLDAETNKSNIAQINTTEGLTMMWSRLSPNTSYTSYAYVTNESGAKILVKNEAKTEEAVLNDNVQRWIGNWSVTSRQAFTIYEDFSWGLSDGENTFNVTISGYPEMGANYVIINGFSVLGEDFPALGVVNGNTLSIMNGIMVGSEGDIGYYWLIFSGNDIYIQEISSYTLTMDESGDVSCSNYNAEYGIQTDCTEVFGVDSDGVIYFLGVSSLPVSYRGGEMDWSKINASATVLSANTTAKKSLSTLPSSLVVKE